MKKTKKTNFNNKLRTQYSWCIGELYFKITVLKALEILIFIKHHVSAFYETCAWTMNIILFCRIIPAKGNYCFKHLNQLVY